MFSNYRTVAFRNLSKNKLFSALNIGGLAIGFAAALLIALFVKEELSYDGWLKGVENVYTFETDVNFPGRNPKTLARTPIELQGALKKDFPEMEETTKFFQARLSLKEGERLFLQDIFQVQSNFLKVFDLPFKEGTANHAFSNNNAIVLSSLLAKKIFGDESALGKEISFQTNNYTVTGVLDSIPGKTHFTFDALLYVSDAEMEITFVDWTSARVYTYFKLAPNVNISEVTSKLSDFWDRNAFFAPESWRVFKPSEVMKLTAINFSDVHLFAKGSNSLSPHGNANIVFGFMGIAALIIGIASVNFINLSTSTASLRAKEIAIRKVVGASRQQVMSQYLAESLALIFIAFVFSLALTEIFAPTFFSLLGYSSSDVPVMDVSFIALTGLASLLIGVISALYPAWHLSKLAPKKSLSSNKAEAPSGAKLRLFLIWLQFSISIGLIISASHFYLQTKFASSIDLGFEKENMALFKGANRRDARPQQDALLREMKTIPGVLGASFTSRAPGDGGQNNVGLKEASGSIPEIKSVSAISVEPSFFNMMDIKLLAGRFLSAERRGDELTTPEGIEPTATIVINEASLSLLGFKTPEEALGKSYRMSDFVSDPALVTIVGVVKNSHFKSLHIAVPPSLFVNYPRQFSSLVVKMGEGDVQTMVTAMEDTWKKLIPDVVVRRSFLDDNYDRQYNQDNQRTIVFTAFASLAVFIATLGVFGLAAFAANRRTKEIGLRKVLGASIKEIISLFAWQFSKPVIAANILAWPLSWYFVNDWLTGYAYRIDIQTSVFLIAGIIVLGISTLTVSYQALRVATRNPIKALRYE